MIRLSLIAALAIAPAAARQPAPAAGLTLDRVVVVMRHGVRPPTKGPPMPAGTARDPWPSWPVKPGYLTPHGEAAVRLIAGDDRTRWIAAGLLPRRGCARVRIVADSDQRTIETGRAYGEALVPGCRVAMDHKPQDVPDPRFAAIEERAVAFDPEVARRAVIDGAGPGGIAGHEARLRPLLARLDAILCPARARACGVGHEPSGLTPAEPAKRPKLTGALDRASTAAQILLLQYADGKPLREVGWGRASASDIARLAEFHAVEFQLLARPRYIAERNFSGLAGVVRAALSDAGPAAPSATMISGHDTNIANLGGLLDAHWQVPGLSRDDPSPGGAIVIERLRDRAGRHYARAFYRSQTIAQIRALTPPRAAAPYRAALAIPGCDALGQRGLCPLETLIARISLRD